MKRTAFTEKGFDEKTYERYYHQHQIAYIRTRLRCVKLYSEGESFSAIAEKLNIGDRSVRNNINLYLTAGYKGITTRFTRKQPKQLTPSEESSFKQIILSTKPSDHGYNGNIWTGQLMIAYIEKTYQVTYKSGIYDLLERLNLSHQRAHADYSNANPAEQIAFIKELGNTLYTEPTTTALVFADEFSVCEKPSCYYGWAEKNTRPTVSTNEKKAKE
jgi:transposase